MADQILYNGVKLREISQPDIRNVEIIDLSALPMIYRMTQVGLPIDPTHFERMGKEIAKDMDAITEKVRKATGHYVNINSGDQVSELLFKKLGLKQIRPKFTRGGDNKEARESVESQVLAAIQHDHEAVPLIQEFKHLSKLKGTYVEVIPKLAKKGPMGPTLYPNIGTTTVPSGRLNSYSPNLLAMPNRTARGREMCEGFIAPAGWCYLSVDLSQIEPRIAAHLSQDPNLIRIYENEEDIYSDFATTAFKLQDNRWECKGFGNIPINAIRHFANQFNGVCDNEEHIGHGWHYPSVHKKDHRFPAKTCILASIYDVTAKGLLEQMPIICANCNLEATKHTCNRFESLWTELKCQDLINAFYIKYPGIMQDRKKAHAQARRYAYGWCMWGRIVHAAAVRSYLPWVVSETLRMIGNHGYQSGAQGILKIGMAKTDDEFEQEKVYEVCKPVLQIHDELLFLVRIPFAKEIGERVVHLLTTIAELRVPLKAGMATAMTWGQLTK